MGDKTIEAAIAEAASDYKLGIKIPEFADQFGGLDQLREELFDLVNVWERESGELGILNEIEKAYQPKVDHLAEMERRINALYTAKFCIIRINTQMVGMELHKRGFYFMRSYWRVGAGKL